MPGPPTSVATAVSVRRLGQLVPGPASAGVATLAANNNLDLCRFGGRVWLAWRTAPSHFASARARLEVASVGEPGPGRAGDLVGAPWRHEATVAVGADLREPRLVADGDRLHLFCFEGGRDPRRFQPRRVLRVTGDGASWETPTVALDAPVVPWRIRRLGGRWALLAYRNAERMYGPRPVDPVVELRWSDDLVHWGEPVDVHRGGTECELVEVDGRLVGLTRMEGPGRFGTDLLWGSDPAHLHTTHCRRKLDSPNLVVWAGGTWVLARRSVAHGGHYDLAPPWLPGALAIRWNQAVWSATRKRGALFRLDAGAGLVEHVADLPSRGDTAFPAALVRPEGTLLVADYTSTSAVGDVAWIRGQLRASVIQLVELATEPGPGQSEPSAH